MKNNPFVLGMCFGLLFTLSGCASMIRQACMDSSAFDNGVNAAKNGENINTGQYDMCEPDQKSAAQKAYREGYMSIATRPQHTTKVENKGLTISFGGSSQPEKQCVEAYGRKACGWDCKQAYGKVACAQDPSHNCIESYGKIQCGKNCRADFGTIKCD